MCVLLLGHFSNAAVLGLKPAFTRLASCRRLGGTYAGDSGDLPPPPLILANPFINHTAYSIGSGGRLGPPHRLGFQMFRRSELVEAVAAWLPPVEVR